MDMRQILKYLADLSENNNWEWYHAHRMENDRSTLNPSFRAHISSKGKQPVPVGLSDDQIRRTVVPKRGIVYEYV